jgi:uncharacterized damage-inducible protein DinB
MIKTFLKELDSEAAITRNMLQRVPDDRYDWKPHEKSMTIKRLVSHIGELPAWIWLTLTTSELDFTNTDYKPEVVENTADLLAYFERSYDKGKAQLEASKEEDLDLPWTMRAGDNIYLTSTKGEIIRMSFNQLIHHRAQLGVFLRLLDIPIPGSYGPSADEGSM